MVVIYTNAEYSTRYGILELPNFPIFEILRYSMYDSEINRKYSRIFESFQEFPIISENVREFSTV